MPGVCLSRQRKRKKIDKVLEFGLCCDSGPPTYAVGFEWKADCTVTTKAGVIQASMPDT